MLGLVQSSKDHLRSCQESYLDHLLFASRAGAAMIGAGLCCIIHGVFPGLFETTGSRTVKSLTETFARRGRVPKKNPVARPVWS